MALYPIFISFNNSNDECWTIASSTSKVYVDIRDGIEVLTSSQRPTDTGSFGRAGAEVLPARLNWANINGLARFPELPDPQS